MSTERCIAEQVLGVPAGTEPSDAIVQSYAGVIGEPATSESINYEAVVGATLGRNAPLETKERIAALVALNELYLQSSDPPTSTNPLFDWHVYQKLREKQGFAAPGTALMVGSMSPLSSRAFSVIAKDMLGADSALVVDIKSGPTKSRQGKFAFGDALRLPLQSGSIHHIVTNQLLHALKDGQAVQPSFRRNAWRFFQEVERVLAPGGQIWMKEAGEKSGKFLEEQGKGAAYTQELLQENMKLAKFMRAAFVRLSMTAVHTESIIGPYGNDYLHDPERQIIPNATHGAVALYARKPPATTRRFVAAAAS